MHSFYNYFCEKNQLMQTQLVQNLIGQSHYIQQTEITVCCVHQFLLRQVHTIVTQLITFAVLEERFPNMFSFKPVQRSLCTGALRNVLQVTIK